ncbi:Oidioi.mRNA.OKI2018_I69.PAR.g12304.t1.cds [Oikopleura dioica]|uniref:Oidioi.mRNA.OKI2018_I69.PAR.g12304.t1.cds n=1 Tax=Oikopleura dioica TaxID=34765 RepID=A0ABN7S2T8_OIKDI|nr:Oidioi.mRNA.OKI2018_I69.PAR.g12304.t1.cds [Oikopleura dioica]
MDDTIPMPDLSHLTEDERQSIMKVMQRQQEEEKREKSMYQSVERNLAVLKEKHLSGAAPNPKAQSSQPPPPVQKSMNTPPKEAVPPGLCPICRKTQLARGCGHRCGFCKLVFCSRCGGKWQVNRDINKL